MATLREHVEEVSKSKCYRCKTPLALDDEVEFDMDGIIFHKGCKEKYSQELRERSRKRWESTNKSKSVGP